MSRDLEPNFVILLGELRKIAGDIPAQNFEARIKGLEHQALPCDIPLDIDHWKKRWKQEPKGRHLTVAALAAYIETLKKGQADEEGQVPELSSAQQRWWLLWSGTFVGVHYRVAAQRLGLHPARVKAIRKSVGLNGRSGLKVDGKRRKSLKSDAKVPQQNEGEV